MVISNGINVAADAVPVPPLFIGHSTGPVFISGARRVCVVLDVIQVDVDSHTVESLPDRSDDVLTDPLALLIGVRLLVNYRNADEFRLRTEPVLVQIAVRIRRLIQSHTSTIEFYALPLISGVARGPGL